ncbi:MAG: putative metal-binding motif-containing protein [Deltaproteobacteria bacterium]|nr:putative metal-binding motif-containing protein [Deltaproteobacteria bacterium]
MRILPLLAALALTACRDKEDPGTYDLDQDGAPAVEDCDDLDNTVFPGAAEVCDGADNDCDGAVDEDATDAPSWYADADADGYGDPGQVLTACARPDGYVERDGDCDDSSSAHHPGAAESDCADPEDYNCDGSVGYDDADGDGFPACEDCDDTAATTHPQADEVCDGADNDCDGSADEEAVDAATWHLDADGDGYGGDTQRATACQAPDGYTADGGDCDDLDADAFPGNPERCDQADNDCNGEVDDDPSDPQTFYPDLDLDGFGAGEPIAACEAPAGTVTNDRDCDDTHAAAAPGGTEVCDGLDNDCDGTTDQGAADASRWYPDLDGDGYAAGAPLLACEAPAGHLAVASDCDDADPAVHPDATERCDGIDNDCNGVTDLDAASPPSPWYPDGDGDGFGAGAQVLACGAPAGYVASPGDCDDLHEAVHPDATERCDGIDNNCNGVTDLDAEGAPTWYLDVDGDGYGADRFALQACAAPGGYVADGGDCDDLSAARSPDSAEVCDGLDNDCDGLVDADDEDLDLGETVLSYPDLDLDGFGDLAGETRTCDLPPGNVLAAGDCDDSSDAVNPDAEEVWYDGVDQDCDLASDYDQDGDGYTSSNYGGEDLLDTDASCWDQCADGTLPERAGTSCEQIAADFPGSSDGIFYIDPTGSGDPALAEERFCAFADGGGWTLVMNLVDGQSYTGAGGSDPDLAWIWSEAQVQPVAEASSEIRFECLGSDGTTQIDIATSHPDWMSRGYAHGDGCAEGYNWTVDVSHFRALPANNYAMRSQSDVSCCCRPNHRLITYQIGFSTSDWLPDDLYYGGVNYFCAGQGAQHMRIWYR